ncbi:MAG: transcriptional repressor [Candidatus Nomurabacteria bacterium]|nr:transcriptional repressor [Candidatus Nomurabacteria bacterium]
MKSKEILFCEEILKEHGYRLTPGRITLLAFLKKTKKPINAGDIQKKLEYKMDKVTLYRALEDFVTSKIIEKINLQDTVSYYEFHHVDHHHHHIVCEKCGKIEDIESCNRNNLQKETLKQSRSFTVINSHSLEFFGICKICNK